MSVTTTPHPDDDNWTYYVLHLATPTGISHTSGDGAAFSCDVDVLGDNVTAHDMVASEEAPIADEMTALVIWIWNRFIGPVDNKHSMEDRIISLTGHFNNLQGDLDASESAFKQFLTEFQGRMLPILRRGAGTEQTDPVVRAFGLALSHAHRIFEQDSRTGHQVMLAPPSLSSEVRLETCQNSHRPSRPDDYSSRNPTPADETFHEIDVSCFHGAVSFNSCLGTGNTFCGSRGDIGPRHQATLTITDDSIALKDECLETLLQCAYNPNGHAVQLLSGVYLELFKFIYLHQEMNTRPPKTDLDWGVFDRTNRVPEKGGSGKMGNLLWYNDAKNKAFRYLTQCRAEIFNIHAAGQCPTYQQEVGKRVKQLKSPACSEKDLRDIFEELQRLPTSHWKRGRPALFTVLETGTYQENDIFSVNNSQNFNPLYGYEGDNGSTHQEMCAMMYNPIVQKDGGLETLIQCTHNPDSNASQPLSGVYLELFRYIHLHQEMGSNPLKTDLDWDVFNYSNRIAAHGGSGKMSNAMWTENANRLAFKYLTQCRAQIFHIHNQGQCPVYQWETGKRDASTRYSSPIRSAQKLRDTFKALQNLPTSSWKRDRPTYLFDTA